MRKEETTNKAKHLYRYMSQEEYELLIGDQTIHNYTDHNALRGSASTAFGFCFGSGRLDTATQALQRLNGIITPDYLLVANPKQPNQFQPCRGRYMDYGWWNSLTPQEQRAIPIGSEKTKYYDEFCTTEYSLSDFWNYTLWQVIGYYTTTHRAKLRNIDLTTYE